MQPAIPARCRNDSAGLRVKDGMDLSPADIPVPPQERHRWRRASQVAAGVLVVVVGLYAFQYFTKGRFWKGTFERIASEQAGRPVRVAGDFQLYLDPHLRFRAEGLSIANPAWAEADALFTARDISLDMSIWRLITGNRIIRNLDISGGRMALQRDARGRNTWTFAGDKPLEIPEIDRAAITDTRLVFIDAVRRARIELTLGDIAATSDKSGQKVAGPLTFTGRGTAYGSPFTLDGSLTTPNETAAGGRVGLDLKAAIADTRITLLGTMPGATRLEGADRRVTVAGRNLQTPGRLFGIILPATRPYALAANLTKAGRTYQFTRIGGHFGDSDLAGRLNATPPATTADRLKLEGALNSRVLDILDVGPFIGYSPERLEAQGGKGAITTVAGRPRILPDAPLASDQLKAFDAAIDYHAAVVRTGTVPISALHVRLGLDNRILKLSPIAFDLAGGRMRSDITINSRVTPVATDYDIRLSQVPLGKLLASFKLEDAGATASMRGRLQLKGYGDTVHKSLGSADGRIVLVFPAGTLWLRNVELAKLDLQNFVMHFLGKRLKKPAQIRCGIVAFTVKGGKAIADPIMFDTSRAIYRGAGGFDFNDESLAMSVEGDSKEFSVFSGQSPIGIKGWFAEPRVNPISGELLTRGAVAVALGVVATPVAALAAFVDFGDAKDQDCTPILAARRDTAKSRAENRTAKD